MRRKRRIIEAIQEAAETLPAALSDYISHLKPPVPGALAWYDAAVAAIAAARNADDGHRDRYFYRLRNRPAPSHAGAVRRYP